MGRKTDKPEVIRTLLRWFGHRAFRVNNIPADRLDEVTGLVGVNSYTVRGRRIQLGKRLRQMNGYAAPGLGARLIVVKVADGKNPAVFQVQQCRS